MAGGVAGSVAICTSRATAILLAQRLGGDQALGQLRALQGDRALRRQRERNRLVVGVEHALAPVHHLQHADQLVGIAHQWQRQHAARASPRRPVDIAV
jgi:hypothetical protein